MYDDQRPQITTGQLQKEVELGQRAQLALELIQQVNALRVENARLRAESSEDESDRS